MESHNRKRLLSAAYRFAFARLVLNYVTFYEDASEYPETAGQVREMEARLAPVLEGFLKGGDDRAQLRGLDSLRRENSRRTEILSCYTDSFSIYEYVLNRVERRFEKKDAPEETPEELAEMILNSLRTSEDAMILDSRMRGLVAQLPIRYTRKKFYEMVHDRFRVYAGAERKGMENLFYMLRTSAMVQQPERMAEAEPELWAALSCLRDTDYRGLDRDGYQACRDSLQRATQFLNRECDICLQYENLINDLYVLFLSKGEALTDARENQVLRRVLSDVRKLFAEGEKTADGGEWTENESLTEALADLEGVQESAARGLLFSENEEDADLRKIGKLLSSSPFVDLEENETPGETADRVWLDQKADEFCGQLDRLFAGVPKQVMRAVMSSVLSQLPMMFQSVDEFKEYVEGSLMSCTDFAEREACMELLKKELG